MVVSCAPGKTLGYTHDEQVWNCIRDYLTIKLLPFPCFTFMSYPLLETFPLSFFFFLNWVVSDVFQDYFMYLLLLFLPPCGMQDPSSWNGDGTRPAPQWNHTLLNFLFSLLVLLSPSSVSMKLLWLMDLKGSSDRWSPGPSCEYTPVLIFLPPY